MSNISQIDLLNHLLCELTTIDKDLPVEVYQALKSLACRYLNSELYSAFCNNKNVKYYQAISDSTVEAMRTNELQADALIGLHRHDRPLHAGRWPLTQAEYNNMPSTFKGRINGKPYALKVVRGKTQNVPVQFLD